MNERRDMQEKRVGDLLRVFGLGRRSFAAASGLGALMLITNVSMSHGEAATTSEVAVESEEGGSEEASGAQSFNHRQDSVELEEGEELLGAIVPLDTFLLNLAKGKYIRMQVQLEFSGLDIPKSFYSRAVPIRDSIITFVTQQKAEDLESAQGKEALREEIKKLVNFQLRKELVRRVYFTQFVIQ